MRYEFVRTAAWGRTRLVNKLGRAVAICAALFSVLLCVVPPSAAQAQQFTKTADGPNYLYARELSDTVLQVNFSLLGYSLKGDAAYEDPGDWDVGPYFSPTIVAATDLTLAIGRIFWLEPGSSMSDLPDAKFVGFDLTECFCSAKGPAISIVSDLTWANLEDDGGTEQDFGCILGAPGVLTSCPILNNGQSQTIPIEDIPLGTPTEYDDPMIVQFTDARDGVPEPETWTVMLMGLGAMGAALRLRRFRAVLTAT